MNASLWQQRLSRDYFSEFEGRGVIVAGGGQGIGAALVSALHWLGARVAILDKSAAGATSYSGGTAPIEIPDADLADETLRLKAVAKACSALGAVNAFVSTIGLDTRQAMQDMTQPDMERLMRVNFYAPFFTARDLLPILRSSGGGAMCLFTSRHGSEIFEPDMSGYGCAKAALDSGIKRLAVAAGAQNTPDNILRVFGFCPGWVQTNNQTGRFSPEQFAQAAREQLIPATMHPEDIIPAVIFCLSRHAGLLSGTTFRFDGGEGQIRKAAVNSGSKAVT